MMRVGFVGWRGMVGSVLMQRMQAERDFDLIEPVFFSTSQAGGDGPAIGKAVAPLEDAAQRIEAAVKKVLAQGLRTADICETEMRRIGTAEMGDAVVAAMQ